MNYFYNFLSEITENFVLFYVVFVVFYGILNFRDFFKSSPPRPRRYGNRRDIP